jgi:two-component system, NtrC family, sensor histidine kinase PilS
MESETASAAPRRAPALTRDAGALDWRILRIANVYRGLIAVLLLALFSLGGDPRLVGDAKPVLFLWTVLSYLGSSIVAAVTLTRLRPGAVIQGLAQFTVDIVALVLIMAASGGPAGLSSLLFFPIGAGSLVLGFRVSILLAAIATIALLTMQGVLVLASGIGTAAITQMGLFGAILFFTATGGHVLSNRLAESEALAKRRGLDLANLSQLNQFIIQHLQTGVLVLDSAGQIRLINQIASEMLGISNRMVGQRLSDLVEPLDQRYSAWISDPAVASAAFSTASSDAVLMPYFMRIGDGEGSGTLVFLEDTRIAREQAQQMKLAALGRLTASIAHEIRNPLAAISHAGELLGEGGLNGDESTRLTNIIGAQSARVNTIVENVMQLSRRSGSRPEELPLRDWLHDFMDEYRTVHRLPADLLLLRLPDDEHDLIVRADPTHLHQVLSNLCDNARKHADPEAQGPVDVSAYADEAGRIRVEVEDRGAGIEPDRADHIFEPFYTGGMQGAGLGLYISRELCEWNRARLDYFPRPDGGSCFRISFPNPAQWVT